MKKEFGYVTDREGNAVAGAEVYILNQSDSSLATLYSDDGVTGTSNPVTTDNDGEWSAYWADGVYKVQVKIEGVTVQEVNHHQHFDIDGFTAFGISLGSAANAAAGATLLGLGTGDSPQFAGINLGHASDTTLTRVSAGVVAVEGVNILTTATGQAKDATLDALAAYSTNGLLTQTAADTFAGRTITGTANEVAVTNGDGVAGNPTLSLPTPIKTHTVELLVTDPNGSAITTGDGKAYYSVPAQLNGCNLVAAAAALTTGSSSGAPSVQIHNLTQAADMLTTNITIDANELHSKDATTPAAIDAANDDVATGDLLRIDVDAAGTGAKGLMVVMEFRP